MLPSVELFLPNFVLIALDDYSIVKNSTLHFDRLNFKLNRIACSCEDALKLHIQTVPLNSWKGFVILDYDRGSKCFTVPY